MKQLLCVMTVALVASARARSVTRSECGGVVVNNVNHEREVLRTGVHSPYQLAIDFDTNTLFFSYTSNTDTVFTSGYCNLKNKQCGDIEGINGGFANAVDGKRHVVYLGGRDGVYSFDYDTKRATRVGAEDHNIWQLFYKNRLYFTTYPDEHAYTYDAESCERVPELSDTRALLVAVDNRDDFIFSNSSGLFRYQRAKKNIVELGDYNLNGITADINGNLFFSTPEGIYYINDSLNAIEKIAAIDNVYGVAVETDGTLIYAENDNVVRLQPTGQLCFVDEKKMLESNKIDT